MRVERGLFGVCALTGAMLFVLAGCGGGGGGGAATQTVSGVVADGYLKGAIVCLDTNGDKKCDGETYKTTSLDNGAYSIPNVTAADLAKYPIIVEVPVGSTDSERGPVTSAYVLTAPAGKPEFISPLTTLVQNQIETNGLSVTEAEATVKTQLGLTTISPLADYKPGVTGASADSVMAAGIAKVIATTIASNKSSIETAVGSDKTTVNQMINMIVQQVMQNLATMVQKVKTETNNGATPLLESKVAGVVTASGVTVSISDVDSLKQQLSAAGMTNSSSDLETAATNGIYSIEQWQNGWDSAANKAIYDYWYEKILYAAATNTIAFTEYDLNGSSWGIRSNNTGNLFLTSAGWKEETGAGGKFDPATNTYSTPNGYEKMTVRAIKMDVASQPIATYLKGNFISVSGITATFPSGALAYKLSFVALEDTYSVDSDNHFCKSWSNTTNACDTYYTSLDDLLATASSSGGNWVGVNRASIQFGALDATTKKGQIKITPYSSDTAQSVVYYSTYERKTVNGTDLIVADTTSLDGKFELFALINGKVQQGTFSPANVARIEKSMTFNKAAIDSIMQAAKLPAAVN